MHPILAQAAAAAAAPPAEGFWSTVLLDFYPAWLALAAILLVFTLAKGRGLLTKEAAKK